MGNKPNWLIINPVDYYNLNHADDGLTVFERRNKAVKSIGLGKYTAILNRGDEEKLMFEFKDGYLEVLEENVLMLEVGAKLSPFELLRKYQFQNNFASAVNWVGLEYMDMEFPFIRVGIKYLKVTKSTDRFGIERTKLTPWAKEEIKQDYGKEMLERVNKYDDFILEPDNKNYHKTVNGNYNYYAPFGHEPEEGIVDWSLRFLGHIFQDDLELGLRYMKVLYERPKQAMPILVLISEDRSTGKSTFLDWLTQVFGANMVIINPADLSSSFNESYATKNIIGIEESKFEKGGVLEKLKAISTQKTMNVNAKFLANTQVPFYGKVIITSNDERKFSKVDEKEIRYWVRKIPKIAKEDANHDILTDLKNEIPAFLWYLENKVADVDYTKSRMVFTPEELKTNALETVVEESRSTVHKDIEMHLNEICQDQEHREELYFRPTDVKEVFFRNNNGVSLSYVHQVLNFEMKLPFTERTTKECHLWEIPKRSRGIHYIYKNPYYDQDSNPVEETQREWFDTEDI